ncbi:hypothetical protein SAMN05660330_02862 [Desulforhopalus singaporensis]|uniref:GtrA-like protein n=1 Tax=Desulforhopalus singaporensis TaxID=91360 RepID=A0A1H0SZU1_9BACT|nr:hypothetical protein SAMN05660330_02862 [Desulforhopalus singaporensis]
MGGVLTEQFGMDGKISKIVAVGIVFLWNFYARKIILFRD